MFSTHFFIALIAIFASITLIQWLFVGFLFHKYQALTPGTWKRETNFSYMGSMALTLFFAFMFCLVFYWWKTTNGTLTMLDGAKFGLVMWITFSLVTDLESGIYVNLSRMFIVGKALSSLLAFVAAGLLAAWLL